MRPKKYLTAESQDLEHESSRFHEFASDNPQQDDWIRYDFAAGQRLTIDDTLRKELAIRQLGKECEEEVQQEEEEEEEADGSKDGDDENEDEDDDEDDDETYDDVEDDEDDAEAEDEDEFNDDHSGYGSDNEVGFASSDDEDDDLVLWTTEQPSQPRLLGATPVHHRRTSIGELSDSSSCSGLRRQQSKPKNRELVRRFRPGTPELPDSTDFVCGTLDEDRPMEDAYLSCLAARRSEKQHLIPQDIDPSFPTSDPEDEDDVAFPAQPHGSDDHLWLHGELEDLHHGQDRMDRRKKKNESPRRCRSPPPKRHHSPAPKARGRSPRRLVEPHSPKSTRALASQQLLVSPPASLPTGQGAVVFKRTAWAPGLTQTKSLPRAPAVFRHPKPHKRGRANTLTKKAHVRGAVDIVMGLEQKRQRRREKFVLQHCNRARRGQVHEKRPQPGVGAERMRELGLVMAGRTEQGNYVLSF